MTGLNDIKRIYFIGIGGIGMSAIARYFNHRGVAVSGYDKTPTNLTRKLTDEGIAIHYTDDIALADKEAQLIVYTPAIPASHSEYQWFINNGFTVVKRSDVLGIITEGTFNICVAGTHGKTSISTMVAHLLRHTGYGCNAFLGGVSANYETNFWASDKQVCVIEADEYDRSFLKLCPDISVVSSMDADHLDIYHTAAAMEQAFVEFAGKTNPGGLLIRGHKHSKLNEAMVRKQLTYQLLKPVVDEDKATATHDHHSHGHDETDEPDIYADHITIEDNGYRFNVYVSGEWLQGFRLRVGGLHNIENMLVAITVAVLLKIDKQQILEAVAAYKGVKRRFEQILEPGRGIIFIDDYAHHPGELEVLIRSIRGLYPGKKLSLVFQPHLFSRTRDFADDFASTLDMADEVVLLPIYPAREQPMEGVNSAMLAQKMSKARLMEKEEVAEWIKTNDYEVLVTAGAGDIDTLVPVIKDLLMRKTNLN